ncbi:MAG: hypothetical protein ABI783_09965 [Actinomycetota bacterium]
MAVVAGAAAVCALVAQVGLGAVGAGAAPAAPLISSAPLRPTISTRATVAFDRVSGLSYECALDGGVYVACPSPVTFRGLGLGLHVFRVRAKKPAGATSNASTYSWRVVAPNRRLAEARIRVRPLMTTAPVLPWISRNATFAWLLKRSTTGECRLDGARWKPCADPKTYLGLRLGRHVFRVQAIRADGHSSSVNRFVWTILASPAPPPPTIPSHPDTTTTSTNATFEFDVAAGSAAECRLDGGDWRECSSPVMYVGLGAGPHTFCVRAVSADGVAGPETCLSWTVLASESPPEVIGPFAVTGNLPGFLSPDATAVLPLTISNPFDFDLRVSALRVTVLVGSSKPGCDGPVNLQVTQSNMVSGLASVVVPAGGSVTLPTQGATAPLVAMLDLATNQDACTNAVFTFSYHADGTRA